MQDKHDVVHRYSEVLSSFKEEGSTNGTTWMNLENMLAGKKKQTKQTNKQKPYMETVICCHSLP